MLLSTFDNYTVAGDAAVIAICIVVSILLVTSYVSRIRSLWIFLTIVGQLVVAAGINIAYHVLLANAATASHTWIYVLRIAYHSLMIDLFFLFILYATVASDMDHRKAKITAYVSTLLLMGVIGADIVLTITGNGFHLGADGSVVSRSNVFIVGYLLFMVMLVAVMSHVRLLLSKRVMYGFYGTILVAIVIRLAELRLNQSSLTTMSFVLPVIAMLYIMHSNPYNVSLGAVDKRAFETQVRSLYNRKTPFVFLSLLLLEYEAEGIDYSKEMQMTIRTFANEFFHFHGGGLFQIGSGRLVLIFPKKRNPYYEKKLDEIVEGFKRQYERLRSPYKIVIGESIDEVSRKNEYKTLIKSIERGMKENTLCRVGQDEIDRFERDAYILQELTDIASRQDLNDPRVLTFCQPVYNLRTGTFDTAEALMRLHLDETGIVLPEDFIPMAEENGYVHILTMIILNKTCRAIRVLTEEGYKVERISVNMSALDLKNDDLCNMVEEILNAEHVSTSKIALELTESSSEADYRVMKEKLEALHDKGIKFYLDDFGIGYSNMERIMKLPFDIIKFDRSLVTACATDKRSERIVGNMATMFKNMGYAVLYEGVENDKDEQRCKDMSATYLQGYKYSKPVPIEQLRDYLAPVG